jgi:inorganic pyrophosphatase
MSGDATGPRGPPVDVEVVIEVPAVVPPGSFLKRDLDGRVHFVSPLPCPFNYGAVPTLLGLEGDLLDAVVLGPRLPFGTRLRIPAWGAVTLTDRGLSDDKLICCSVPPSAAQWQSVLRFFRVYARCKALLNAWRGRPGRNACDGWRTAASALARARPIGLPVARPPVPF